MGLQARDRHDLLLGVDEMSLSLWFLIIVALLIVVPNVLQSIAKYRRQRDAARHFYRGNR